MKLAKGNGVESGEVAASKVFDKYQERGEKSTNNGKKLQEREQSLGKKSELLIRGTRVLWKHRVKIIRLTAEKNTLMWLCSGQFQWNEGAGNEAGMNWEKSWMRGHQNSSNSYYYNSSRSYNVLVWIKERMRDNYKRNTVQQKKHLMTKKNGYRDTFFRILFHSLTINTLHEIILCKVLFTVVKSASKTR